MVALSPNRSRKSVARWSPDDPASPTGYGTPKTPKTAVKVGSSSWGEWRSGMWESMLWQQE